MNTSILGDKIIMLWQVLLGGGAVVFSVAFGAWLMGRKWRKKGEQPPSLAHRVEVCTAVAIASLLGLPVVFGFMVTLIHMEMPCVTLPGVAIFIGCIVTSRSIRRDWTRSVKPQLWMIGLICGIIGTMCFAGTVGRFRVISKRVIDGANLNGVGIGLGLYHAEYDAYPDDLRRLVDTGITPADLLRSIYGSEKPHKPRSVPYDGPCDYIYIRLPEDAPDDLIRVWQPVEYHDNEGGNVLFKDGNVRWLTPERLIAELAKTYRWLEARPTTQPATAPGT
ncbi:MAG: hypothetical protein KAV00_04520 [Phycisphaerae bacterium]|nr:hypothetical protein [Phycisphaerae bacterium]